MRQVIQCPLCNWHHDIEPPKVPPEALASVFGPGVMAQIAMNEHARDIERALEDHFKTHTLAEWVRALTKDRAEIERLQSAIKPLAKVPLEAFGWENKPDKPITGWNDHTLYVRDVLAARAVLPTERVAMTDDWKRWHPTPRLRWVLPGFTVPASSRRLQQEYQHEETGRVVWRNVPVVIVEASEMDGASPSPGVVK